MLVVSELTVLLERGSLSIKPGLSSPVDIYFMSTDRPNAVNISSVHDIVRPCLVSCLYVLLQILVVLYVG